MAISYASSSESSPVKGLNYADVRENADYLTQLYIAVKQHIDLIAGKGDVGEKACVFLDIRRESLADILGIYMDGVAEFDLVTYHNALMQDTLRLTRLAMLANKASVKEEVYPIDSGNRREHCISWQDEQGHQRTWKLEEDWRAGRFTREILPTMEERRTEEKSAISLVTPTIACEKFINLIGGKIHEDWFSTLFSSDGNPKSIQEAKAYMQNHEDEFDQISLHLNGQTKETLCFSSKGKITGIEGVTLFLSVFIRPSEDNTYDYFVCLSKGNIQDKDGILMGLVGFAGLAVTKLFDDNAQEISYDKNPKTLLAEIFNCNSADVSDLLRNYTFKYYLLR